MAVKIWFLGDSTLDNGYWFINGNGSNLDQAKADSVEGQLKATLGNDYEVTNYAYDGFTTESVLDHGTVGQVLPGYPSSLKFQAYAELKNPNRLPSVQPLTQLSASIRQHDASAKHFVVISVGGNDFRACLDKPVKLLTIFSDVRKRYLKIVQEVQKLGPNVHPILMFQYPTSIEGSAYNIYPQLGGLGAIAAATNLLSLGILALIGSFFLQSKISAIFAASIGTLATAIFASSIYLIPFKATIGILKGQRAGVTVIGALMERLYRPIVEYAKNHDICILDLPNTFNPFQTNLYINQIEPSKEGGAVIAKLIAEAVITQRQKKICKIFRGDLSRQCEIQSENITHWSVDYPSKKS
jgi:hypothetical protein